MSILNSIPENSQGSVPTNELDGPLFLQERLFVPYQQIKISHLQEVGRQEWQPKSEVEIQVKNEPWSEANRYMVSLTIHFVVKNQNMTIVNLDLTQSGIFRLERLDVEQQKFALNAAAPDQLFPYLRKGVADAMMNAALPPIWLTPMSFAAMYQQQKQKNASAQEGKQDIDNVFSSANQTGFSESDETVH